MNRRIVLATTVLALASACSGSSSVEAGDARLAALRASASLDPCPAAISTALPHLTLPCLGSPGTVETGAPGTRRPTVVNVWATWCQPCVKEVPELVRLARDGAGRLDLIGILTQDEPRNGLEFARQMGMPYPSVVDDDGVVMRRFSPGPPVTLFLDASGAIRHIQRGLIKDDSVLRQLVREHLDLDLPLMSTTAKPS